jgi:glycosyltransferase involved in cell wall biosynthesis
MSRSIDPADPTTANPTTIKLAVLRRVVMPYRLGLLRELSSQPGIRLKVFHGEDVPGSKVVNAKSITGFESQELPTRFFKAGKLVLAQHRGLLGALEEFQPDVILCEGESNLLSYLTGLRYRARHPETAVLLWSLVWLIGKPLSADPLSYLYKRIVHRRFDAFVAFSSYSKVTWQRLGIPAEKIVVAPNVADTTNHLRIVEESPVDRAEARKRLGIPDGFTVLYAGTLDRVKKPGVLLEVARSFQQEGVNFIFLGRGPLLNTLKEQADSLALKRVFFPGFVDPEKVPLYYFASNMLVVPGRGGMVISEAMAYGLPVVVHQADGTEVDLVEQGKTGFRLDDCHPDSFAAIIRDFIGSPEMADDMGREANRRARELFSTSNTARKIAAAVKLGLASRSRNPVGMGNGASSSWDR